MPIPKLHEDKHVQLYFNSSQLYYLNIYKRKTDFKLRKPRFKTIKKWTSWINYVSLKLINTVNTIHKIFTTTKTQSLKFQGWTGRTTTWKPKVALINLFVIMEKRNVIQSFVIHSQGHVSNVNQAILPSLKSDVFFSIFRNSHLNSFGYRLNYKQTPTHMDHTEFSVSIDPRK